MSLCSFAGFAAAFRRRPKRPVKTPWVAMPKMSAVDFKSMLAQAVAESDRQMEIVGHTVGNGPDESGPAETTSQGRG
jgi:hypothetical protein